MMAINDPFMNVEYMAYLLKYDSVFGRFPGTVEVKDGQLAINGQSIQVFHEKDPGAIPWGNCGVDYL